VLQICPHIIHVAKTVIHIKVHMPSVASPTSAITKQQIVLGIIYTRSETVGM